MILILPHELLHWQLMTTTPRPPTRKENEWCESRLSWLHDLPLQPWLSYRCSACACADICSARFLGSWRYAPLLGSYSHWSNWISTRRHFNKYKLRKAPISSCQQKVRNTKFMVAWSWLDRPQCLLIHRCTYNFGGDTCWEPFVGSMVHTKYDKCVHCLLGTYNI
jgi:hypothetical protein